MMMSSGEEEYYGDQLQLGLDIEIEILKRLPPKSLVRFTSVSKQWKSIIRSSRFISGYSNGIQQPSSNLFFVGSYRRKNYAVIRKKQRNKFLKDYFNFQQLLALPDSDDNFRDFDSCCELIGYSQGLFGFFNRKDRLVIWNPAIRKSLFIPLPPDLWCPYNDHICFTVVCNATEPTIFCITDYSTQLRVKIYTLNAEAWRTVSYTPRASLGFTGRREVTDRFIYWIGCYWSNYIYDSSKYVIMSFDIASEQFTELCLPPALAIQPYTSKTSLDLSKLRESLVVVEIDKSKQEIGVWMMKTESGGVENSFTKHFTVNRPAHTPNLPTNMDMHATVLGFTIDGQIILLMEVWPAYAHVNLWQLLYYEPDSKSFIYIGKPRKYFSHLAGSYMETLLLLDH